jgi:hypothetical protein
MSQTELLYMNYTGGEPYRRAPHLTDAQWEDQLGWYKRDSELKDSIHGREVDDDALVVRYRRSCAIMNRNLPICQLIRDEPPTDPSEFGTMSLINVVRSERQERHSAIAPGEAVVGEIFHTPLDADGLDEIQHPWNFYAMHRFKTRGKVDVFNVHLLHQLVGFLFELERNFWEDNIEYVLDQAPYTQVQDNMTCCEKLNTQFGLLWDQIFNTLKKALY